VLKAIAFNNDPKNANSSNYPKWKFNKDDYRPPQLPEDLYGEIPVEGKVDSCGVLYFGGLFILANEIKTADMIKDKIVAVPKFRVIPLPDGGRKHVAVVMPHPSNFVQLLNLIEDIHEYTDLMVSETGPLLSAQFASTAPAAAGKKGKAGSKAAAAAAAAGEDSPPDAHPAIIRSFPATGCLKRNMVRYLGDTKQTPAAISKYMNEELHAQVFILDCTAPRRETYEVAFAYPHEITRILGRPETGPTNHNPLRTGLSVAEPYTWEKHEKRLFIKQGTSNQCGHIDGLLTDEEATWVSMIAPISRQAFLRYWPQSHLLTERMLYLTYKDPVYKKYSKQKFNDEIIMQVLREEAEQWGLLDTEKAFPYDTLRIVRGDSVIFLPTWVHAGACLPSQETCINYRLHAYIVQPNTVFNQSNTSDMHSAYETFLRGFNGSDYDLSELCG
jgi:hypothetical protein